MGKEIKVGDYNETNKRWYGWDDIALCYTGYNSKPFKVDEDNYQIKCIRNSGGWSVNKFNEIHINFNLKELGITEEEFLSHFVMPGYIIEFKIYYDRAKRLKSLVFAYYYCDNVKFRPDRYGRYAAIFNKLDKMKPQEQARIDVPNPDYLKEHLNYAKLKPSIDK